MTLASVATEVTPDAADWTGFVGSRIEDHAQPRRWLKEIRSGAGELLYRYRVGTVTSNEWLPSEVYALALEPVKSSLCEMYGGVDFVTRTAKGGVIVEIRLGNLERAAASNEEQASAPLPESAVIAKEIRELSGLSAERLAEMFPVERESYQRWMSGKITPSSANLERLLALRHLMRELANRVDSPKTWLLAPLSEGTSSPTPYDALKVGNLTTVWNALAEYGSKAQRYTRRTPDGDVLTVTEGSLRGRDIRTAVEELEDYEEWASEDE